MNYNIKIKLIGYYTGEKQNMNPEKRFQEEAVKLAELFGKTFAETFSSVDTDNLSDKKFVNSLSSNSVYIFKDEDKNLYAYFPAKRIARLSSVFFDRKSINRIPSEYKSWFVPGEKIPFIPLKEKKHKSHRPGIFLCNINGDDIEYTNNEFSISTAGSDFLIHLRKRTFALDWDPDIYISIKELDKLIKHKWTYLDETNTDDGCGDCDGYDYDNCDMSRCKNDCEHCGGRIYICNNGCFYHRYDTCVSIEADDDLIEEDLREQTEILNKIIAPHSKHRELLQKNRKELDSLNEECLYIEKYVGDRVPAQTFSKLYRQALKIEDERNSTGHRITVEVIDGKEAHTYRMLDKYIETKRGGFLWLKDKLVLDGYDFVSDDNVKEIFLFKISDGMEKKLFHKIEKNIQSLSKIKVVISDKKTTVDIVSH